MSICPFGTTHFFQYISGIPERNGRIFEYGDWTCVGMIIFVKKGFLFPKGEELITSLY
jgi:hypothetical protein